MRNLPILLAAILLTGCGRTSENTVHKLNTFDVEEAPPSEPTKQAPAAGPQIAYSYTITYAFDRRTVAEVQGRQLALCRQLGSARCLVVKSTLSAPGPGDHVVNDEAVLFVDARLAGQMNQRLDAIAMAGGARPANR
ncbi:MAG: hypothetical protein QM688_01280 [Sphingomonas bacterium]